MANVERIAALLEDEPGLTAAAVAAQLGIRTYDAQRAVKILRRIRPEQSIFRVERRAADTVTITLDVDELLPKVLWTVLVKYLAEWRCQRCRREPDGSELRKLCAHHVDRDATNHRLANGVALCTACHSRLHAALRGGEDVLAAYGPFLASAALPKSESAT